MEQAYFREADGCLSDKFLSFYGIPRFVTVVMGTLEDPILRQMKLDPL
jgi:hypothetical protein